MTNSPFELYWVGAGLESWEFDGLDYSLVRNAVIRVELVKDGTTLHMNIIHPGRCSLRTRS
jgi:hypothetical protein